MKTLIRLAVIITVFLVGCREHTGSIKSSETSLLELPGNRTLSYVEFGPVNGIPVLYFHGFPGSHRDVYLFKGHELAEKYQLRLIAVDRPGYGNSGSLPDRKLSDWPEDIAQLTSSLDLESYSILAYSGGGPFALACAYANLEGLQKTVIVSGMGPAEAPEAKKGSAMLIPKAPKLILKGMSKMLVKNPEKIQANMKKGFPEVDLTILERPEVTQAMMGTLKEAFSSGYLGALEDARIYKKPWGFDLSDIQNDVILLHGGKDENVKPETAEFIAEQLPACRMDMKRDEGHLSLIYNHAEKIFLTFTEYGKD